MKIARVALVVAAVCLAGCSSSSGPRTGPGTASEPEPQPELEAEDVEPAHVDVVRSALRRDTNPQLSDAERDILAASQVGFAVDFYHAVRRLPERAGQNVFLSPRSVSIALAMTYAGARGETAAEMKKALRFELPDDRLHAGFGYLDLELASHSARATGSGSKPTRLDIASAIWGQKGSSFEAPFLDTLAVHYGAALRLVDFVGETERSRVAVQPRPHRARPVHDRGRLDGRGDDDERAVAAPVCET